MHDYEDGDANVYFDRAISGKQWHLETYTSQTLLKDVYTRLKIKKKNLLFHSIIKHL